MNFFFFLQGKAPKEIHVILIETLGEHAPLDMRKLSAKWVLKCLNADQEHQQCHYSEQISEFFGAIQMISCRDW